MVICFVVLALPRRPMIWANPTIIFFTSFRTLKLNYGLLLVGALSGNPEKFTRAYCGLFTKTGLMPKKKLSKFRVTANAVVQPGTQLRASHFQPGQFVDILGRRQVNSPKSLYHE